TPTQAYSDVEADERVLPARQSPEQLAVDVEGATKRPVPLAVASEPSSGLSLGAPPRAVASPESAGLALASEQRERRAAQTPVAPVSPGAGATPKQIAAQQPQPFTPSGVARPEVTPQEPSAVPVPAGPKFTEPGRATPQEAAADIENLKTITGVRGYGQMAAGMPVPLSKAQLEGTEPVRPENYPSVKGATEVLKGATTAATPLMVAGAVLQPELTALAMAGGYAGGKGARKLAEALHASSDVQDLAEQAGQIAGAFAGGGAYGGLKHLANPEEALADLLWKRGYIQDNSGSPIYITSQTEARAVAQEIIKQNPQSIIGSYIAKQRAQYAAANVPARQYMGVAEPAPPQLALPAYSDVTPGERVIPPAGAPAEHPAVKDAISNIIKPIQGAELAGAREEKEPERLGEKIENEGQSPRTVRDYSGYRIAVDTPAAKEQVVAALKQNFEVHAEQDNFAQGDLEHGFHAHTLNVREPGSPVSHEVQILPREVADSAEANHPLYEKARDGDQAAITELKQKNADDWNKFQGRQEAQGAVQIRSTAALHGGTQEATREEGRKPEGMGGSDRLQQTPGQVPEAAKEEGVKYKFGNTQANIPADSEASKALDVARSRISDADLAGKGKDIGEGGNHVTVRYGIKGDDTEGIKNFIRSQAPFEASLGKTEKFPVNEHTEGTAPIIAPIEAPELHRLNAEMEKHGDFNEPSFKEYRPHATVAYVDPAKADRYVGMDVTAGKKFTVSEIAISKQDGSQEIVRLEGNPKLDRRYNPPAATEEPRSAADLATRAMLSSEPAKDVGQAARAAGQAPKPPLSRTMENLKGQAVEVRDASGAWKPGKVLADNTGDRGLRRLRGVLTDENGKEVGKFDNVKLSDVRREAARGRERGTENKPAISAGETVTRSDRERTPVGPQ